MARFVLALFLLGPVLLAPLLLGYGDDGPSPSSPRLLVEDGAWCWFADPRAVHHQGEKSRTYLGWVSSQGDIMAGALDPKTGALESTVLHSELEVDDHDNPSFWVRPDGRILAAYTRHSGRALRLRLTEEPENISTWGKERELRLNPAGPAQRSWYTYPNFASLSEESNRLYLFWRGYHWKPTVAISDDHGDTWKAGRVLFSEPDAADANRPYLKVGHDGRRRIHFALSTGHPRNEPRNSIHYAAYEGDSFRRADGTQLGGWDDLPLAPSRIDTVYDGSAGRAWIWDVTGDREGRPVVVYTRLPKETEHEYRYARWNGEKWEDHLVTAAGGWFPQTPEGKKEPEPHYSGGVVLDPANPTVVYLSRPTKGVFEMERWITSDGGKTWASRPLTQNSKSSHVRPVVVRGYGPGSPKVLWMHIREHYIHYTRFETSIWMLPPAP